MPLLGDSKNVYVGTTPITKVMAQGVQVWPKGPPLPFRNIEIWAVRFNDVQFAEGFCEDAAIMDCKSPFITWEVNPRPKNCTRGSVYKIEQRRNDQPGDWGPTAAIFGANGWRSYLPDLMPNSMAMKLTTNSSFNADTLKRWDYRLVYDDGIEPPVYSETLTFTGTDEELRNNALPLEYQETECNGRP
jgi:hypothetical protein